MRYLVEFYRGSEDLPLALWSWWADMYKYGAEGKEVDPAFGPQNDCGENSLAHAMRRVNTPNKTRDWSVGFYAG
jgi:hypothetical protein